MHRMMCEAQKVSTVNGIAAPQSTAAAAAELSQRPHWLDLPLRLPAICIVLAIAIVRSSL
jgi:hypothetical protein